MKKLKDSFPEENKVRINLIDWAGVAVRKLVERMVKFMLNKRAHRWSDSLKVELMIPIHMKGPRNNKNIYHGVVLLAMGSRILARIIASRLKAWVEGMELLIENQKSFRPRRSTADATQTFVRIYIQE